MKTLIFSIVLCLMIPSISVASYAIKLKNGRKISAQYYWKESGQIFFHIYGGTVGIPSDRIVSIHVLDKEEIVSNEEKNSTSKENSIHDKNTKPETEMDKGEVNTDYYIKKKTELIEMLKMQYKKLEEATSKGKKHRIERREVKIEKIKSTLNKLAKEIMEKNRGVLPSWWKDVAEPKQRSSSQ